MITIQDTRSGLICTIRPCEIISLKNHILKAYEEYFDTDLSDVTIISCEIRPSSIYALTCGGVIYINEGVLLSETQLLFQIIGHELTHVVQQGENRIPRPYSKRQQLRYDPQLEVEAFLNGSMSSLHVTNSNYEQPILSRTPCADKMVESAGVIYQPLLIIGNVTATMEHFDTLWGLFDGEEEKPLYNCDNRLLVQKVRAVLRRWIVTPERSSLLSKRKGIRKEYGSRQRDLALLTSAVIGEAKAELNGGSKSKEARIAATIERRNTKISTLLIKGLEHIYFNFHTPMIKKPDFRRLVREHRRAYAWYYSGGGQRFAVLAQKAFTFSLGSPFDQRSLCSVEDAFIKFICSPRPVPSWKVIAFISDYAKIVKEVYPSYFSDFSEKWYVSESEVYAEQELQFQDEQDLVERRTERSLDKFFQGRDRSRTSPHEQQIVKDSLRRSQRKRRKREITRGYKAEVIDQGKFHRVRDDDSHMFFKLPGMRARTETRGSQVDESHEWVKKAREHGILLENGPSATTMFILGMFQILYPHEETVLAAAVAIFEFWNKHYQAKHSGIHTWHEVMYVAQQYTSNFDFGQWKKVDRKTREEAWRFAYPNARNFNQWLQNYERRRVITLDDVRRMANDAS